MKLNEMIKAEAKRQGKLYAESLSVDEAADAEMDGFKEAAIEACFDFGLTDPNDPRSDLFIAAYASGAQAVTDSRREG